MTDHFLSVFTEIIWIRLVRLPVGATSCSWLLSLNSTSFAICDISFVHYDALVDLGPSQPETGAACS